MTIFEAVFAPNDATMQSPESRMFGQGYQARSPRGSGILFGAISRREPVPAWPENA
jgi:hypothetical protein